MKNSIIYFVVIATLTLCCQYSNKIRVVNDFINSINKKDRERLDKLLSDSLEHWVWTSETDKSLEMHKVDYLERLKNYEFLNVKFSILSLEQKKDVICTREKVVSDIYRVLENEMYFTKEYHISNGKIVRIYTLYGENNVFYDKFWSWITANYLSKEREMTEKIFNKDKDYLDDLNFLYKKYKNNELPEPKPVPTTARRSVQD